jgi:hypothetical protein
VGAGRYFIEKGWGLRNALDKAEANSSDTRSKDAAPVIFGQILNQALGGSASSSSSANSFGIQSTSILSDTPSPTPFPLNWI